jgi:hypothetical protein
VFPAASQVAGVSKDAAGKMSIFIEKYLESIDIYC